MLRHRSRIAMAGRRIIWQATVSRPRSKPRSDSHHSRASLARKRARFKTSPPMVIRMSTIPLTTEGRIFVARMIRDVRDRERMSFGTVQANCYPRRRPPAPIVMKMVPHRHGQRRIMQLLARTADPNGKCFVGSAIWRMGG